jgi:hypothetical protein
VRKIISILAALGVILGLTLVAVPLAADETMDGVTCPTDCSGWGVVDADPAPGDFCAGMSSDYWIGWSPTGMLAPITLIPGTDSLSVEFPTGTDLTKVGAGDVILYDWTLVQSAVVPLADITGNTAGSTRLEFVIPVGFLPNLIAAGDVIEIDVYDVVNPPVPGKYCLFVDYIDDCCTPVVFDCVEYTVSPAYKEYAFHFDFDKTFPGIAEDFIPPFKACGQNRTADILTEWIEPIGWFDVFDVILRDENHGCMAPCGNASMWFVIDKCPVGETISFVWDELGVNWFGQFTAADIGIEWALPDHDLVNDGPPPDVKWECKLHFSSPGTYQMTFYLQCPAVQCGAGEKTWSGTLPITVHQWKDPGKIILEEKWNLVSLPIVPFDTDIASLLASLDAEALDKDGVDDLLSIHYYDRSDFACVDPGTWKVYAHDGSQTSLETMEDGKSYWVRMTYPNQGNMPYTWWIFGTAVPMPPGSPREYPACTGWNMLGLTSRVDVDIMDYLWNWNTSDYVVYGWDNTGSWLTSGWDFVDPWGAYPEYMLETGQGYWACFAAPGGSVFVPGP